MSNFRNPNIWGPNYWFFLHSIADCYPEYPTDIIKKKYYEFIQNLPIFIPNTHVSNDFCSFLDKYPVSPYLDNRESFKKWVFFIHNKMNSKLGKLTITYEDSNEILEKKYESKDIKSYKDTHICKTYIYIIFSLVLCICIILIKLYL
jgi:hypothetical protein